MRRRSFLLGAVLSLLGLTAEARKRRRKKHMPLGSQTVRPVPAMVRGIAGALQERPGNVFEVLHEHFIGATAPNGWFNTNVGTGARGGSGAPTNPTADLLTTGTTANSSVLYGTFNNWASALLSGYNRDATFLASCKLSAVDANSRVMMGFSQSLSLTAKGVFIGYDGSINTANFICTANVTGGGVTPVDTLVAVDTNWHVFEVRYDSDSAVVTYWIDGSKVAELDSTLFDASPVGPQFSVENGATAAAVTLSVDLCICAEALG